MDLCKKSLNRNFVIHVNVQRSTSSDLMTSGSRLPGRTDYLIIISVHTIAKRKYPGYGCGYICKGEATFPTRQSTTVMGNTVKRATDYLRDPYLVRRIQEAFGVKQIIADTVSDPAATVSDTQDPKAALTANSSSVRPDISISSNGGLMNGKIDWLTSMPKKRRRLKVPGCHTTSPSPASSSPSSPDSDNAPEFPEVIVESHPFLDVYFRIATELGYEPFYITFLPCVFWNVDSYVGHHFVIIWCLSMYVGQASKSLFKWKRPASPPALRLEQNPNLETEFGFPSTHAIVATVIPFFMVYCCFGRYDVSVQI